MIKEGIGLKYRKILRIITSCIYIGKVFSVRNVQTGVHEQVLIVVAAQTNHQQGTNER